MACHLQPCWIVQNKSRGPEPCNIECIIQLLQHIIIAFTITLSMFVVSEKCALQVIKLMPTFLVKTDDICNLQENTVNLSQILYTYNMSFLTHSIVCCKTGYRFKVKSYSSKIIVMNIEKTHCLYCVLDKVPICNISRGTVYHCGLRTVPPEIPGSLLDIPL